MVLVDIVTPAHNAERFIAAMLASVRAQTLPEWHARVVDDASTDGTAEAVRGVAAQDARVCLLASPQNAGAARARNRALAEGGAPYVAFLDSDDLWEPYALEVLLEALERHPDAPAAHGFGRNIDVTGQPLPDARGSDIVGLERPVVDGRAWRYLAPYEHTSFEAFAVSCPIPTPGLVLVRRSALEALGTPPWDPEAFPADDWLLWLRLTEGGAPFAFVPRPVLRYRRHPAQATTRTSPHLGAPDHYVRAWVSSRATPAQQQLLEAGRRFEWRRTAALRARWGLQEASRGRPAGTARQVRHAALALARSF